MFFEFVTVQIQQNMNVALEELNAFVVQYILQKNMNYVFYICSYVTVINSYQGTCLNINNYRIQRKQQRISTGFEVHESPCSHFLRGKGLSFHFR